VLRRSLLAAQAAFRGGKSSASELRQVVLKTLAEAEATKVDYVQIVNAATLQPVARVERGSVITLAVFFGKTRLIDNLELR
jgi:pantoate--beta-alanine ligase